MLKNRMMPQLALWLSLLAGGAQAGEVIISEYIEGSSNNKALEIFNGSDTPVDLGNHSIEVYFNGSSSPGVTIALGGSLAPGDVFVLAQSSADPALLAAADQLFGGGFFNGDDAVALVGLDGFVDVIGQIGVDPGSQWGDASTGTQNQTLRRNAGIETGRTDGTAPFDPGLEWTSAGLDNFMDIGRHGDGGGDVELGQCGDPATLISAVQGSGLVSPLIGERHEIEAIVVGDFQDVDTGLAGFFLQEGDSDQDGLDTTSEGLFVFDNGFGVDVQVGDLVRVGGIVNEFFGLTQLGQVDGATVCGSSFSASAAQVNLPFADADWAERYEGMLAQFPQTLTVNDNFNLGRFGELVISAGRLQIPTNIVEPGPAAAAQQAANDLNRIVLDDGSDVQNPELIPYPAPGLRADNSLRAGDTVSGLRGIISFGFSSYRVHPVEQPQFAAANPRTTSPALPGEGSLRLASFNVLNYFNGSGQGGGFPTSRGADTLEEFQRQRAKIISAIADLNADIVGLMEIENDGFGPDSAIQDLVDGLNAAADSDVYAFVNPGQAQLGGDEIAVGILYRSDKVQPLGDAATIDSSPFDFGNRQPLLQTFTEITSGEAVSVVVNHFKSKGSCPGDGSLNDDQNDGQSCWNQLRTQAAGALADWLASDPAGTGVERTLILGDLNSYARENPIATLVDAGYVDLLAGFQSGDTYSFVFQGEAGYLDHTLANAALAPLVTGATVWHINADEPRVLDYNTESKSEAQQDSLYSAGPYRASDHDPVLVELDLTAGNVAPTADFTTKIRGKRVQFSDQSSDSDGRIVSWHWQFGDGETSTEQNPSHRYRKPGRYSVVFRVEDERGASATVQRELLLESGNSAPKAQFRLKRWFNWVWVQARGGKDLNYHWNFGDGTEMEGRQVWHRYNEKGNYQLTLTVSDAEGNTASKTRRVVVRRPWWLP